MGVERALDEFSLVLRWRTHALRRSELLARGTVPSRSYLRSTEDDDRPTGFENRLPLTGCLLDRSDDTQSPLKGGGHILVDVRKIATHDSNLVTVTSKKGDKLLVVHATVDSSLADLETVYVHDGQNGSGFLWIDVLCSVPGTVNGDVSPYINPQQGMHSRGRGSSFSLPIPDDDGDDQLGFIHDGTKSDGESVSEFATFVYRSRNLSVDVRGEAAWGRESGDQIFEPNFVEAVLGEEFGEGALDPESSKDGGCTVT